MKTQIFSLLFILSFFYSGSIHADNGINEQGLKTDKQALSIFPNPINEKGTIKLSLDEPSDLQIIFFDLSGKKVMELKKFNLDVGEHNIDSRPRT